ncbi:MAG: hypothetical protein HY791_38185 [Deltaproteobacteria bacterium]|nr:hypothetical protein [Deltaproteobacteria bacterium]
MRIFTASIALSVLGIAPLASAADCKLKEVDRPEAAKIVVFFTKFAKEDNSGGRFKTCKIVTSNETETFFVTAFRKDATVVVHTSSWPKR